MGRKRTAKHGSISMYNNDKCRCDECTTAYRNWKREYRKRKPDPAPTEEQRAAQRERNRVYYADNRAGVLARQRVWNRLKKYGIADEDFQQRLLAQGGRCAICRSAFSDPTDNWKDAPRVDHDHATGAVRGLLCHQCNAGIGLLKDDVSNLKRAVDYLMR